MTDYEQQLVNSLQKEGLYHNETLNIIFALSSIYYETGKIEKAKSVLLRAKTIISTIHERVNFKIIPVNIILADIYYSETDISTSSDILSETLRITKLNFGVNHKFTANVKLCYSFILILQDNLNLAKVNISKARRIHAINNSTNDYYNKLLYLIQTAYSGESRHPFRRKVGHFSKLCLSINH